MLCSENANLAVADTTFVVMLEEIKKFDTVLSRQLYAELVTRISSRQTIASDVIHYLRHPFTVQPISKHLKVADEKDVKKALKDFAMKFGGYSITVDDTSVDVDASMSDSDSQNTELSFEDKLRKAIDLENKVT